MAEKPTFPNLYTYQTKNGVIQEQTSTIRGEVETFFKYIFGDDFSVEAETPQGRLIEAITLHFVDVLGVNAQNANSFNVTQAVGEYLDNLGALFGVTRGTDEGDTAYRQRILASSSRGSGFAASIRQAIGNVVTNASTNATIGIANVVVLDNGLEDPQVLPRSEKGETYPHSISVDPHSIYVAVLCSDSDNHPENTAIANAIRNTKSAGCGYSTSPGGTTVTVYVNDEGSSTDNTTAFKAVFYRPVKMNVSVAVTVIDTAYTGTDIVGDTKAAVKALLDTKHMNATTTKEEISAAISSAGKGIIYKAATITQTDGSSQEDLTSIVVPAYRYLDVQTSDITVTVDNTFA